MKDKGGEGLQMNISHNQILIPNYFRLKEEVEGVQFA